MPEPVQPSSSVFSKLGRSFGGSGKAVDIAVKSNRRGLALVLSAMSMPWC